MSARSKNGEGLTIQEALFVEAYLACNCNGTEACRRAGYSGNDNVLAVQANRLLSRAKVSAALDDRRHRYAMDAYETLQRISDHARASIEDFLDDAGSIDLVKAKGLGKMHLVKKLTQRIIPAEDGDIRQTTLQLHDAQAALRDLMRHHGLLKDDVPGKDTPKSQRELDELLTAEIRRVKGPEAADAIAEVLRRFSGEESV